MPKPPRRGKRLQQRESNFRALYRAYRKRAKEHSNRPFELTEERFRELVTSNCFICGAVPKQRYKHDKKHGEPFIYNGIDRMDNDLGYVEGNVAPCCAHCNYAKGTHSLEQFLLYIYRAYKHAVLPALQEGKEPEDESETDT